MAATHGRSGVIQISAVGVGQLTSWSISETVDEVDATPMAASAKVYLAGLSDGTVSVDCFWDASDAGQEDIRDALAAGSSITVNIYPSGSTSAGAYRYTGTVTITQCEVTGDVGGAITTKFTGRGTMTLGTVS